MGDIGAAIQGTVEAEGLAVIRTFVGAAIGRQLHEPPAVPCYGVSGRGQRLTVGQLFHIQVILKEGTPDVAIAENGCMMEVGRDGCRLLGRFLDEPVPSSLQ